MTKDTLKAPMRENSYNDLLQEVQQQFLAHRENTNLKLQKIEEMIELAVQKFCVLRSRKSRNQEKGFMSHFDWKTLETNGNNIGDMKETESVHHFELGLPKFERGARISELLENCEQHLAVEEPIYDEEPGEGLDCWPEQEFILAALRGDNSSSHDPLQSKLRTTERSEEIMTPVRLLVPQMLDQAYKNAGNCTSYDKLVQSRAQDQTNKAKEVQQGQSTMKKALAHKQMTPQGKHISGTMQKLKPNQLEERMSIGLFPYCPKVERPQHCCKQVDQIMTTTETQGLIRMVTKASKGQVQEGSKDEGLKIPLEILISDGTVGHTIADEVYLKADNCMDLVEVGKGKDQQFETQIFLSERSKELGELSNKEVAYNLKPMFTFDPGGYVQNIYSNGVTELFKEMIKDKVKLDEVAIINSTCDQPGQQQVLISLKFLAIELLKEYHPGFVVQFVNSAGIPGQDIQKINNEVDRIISEINHHCVRVELNVVLYWYNYIVSRQCSLEISKMIRFKYHKASRRSVTIYIFDPGGDLSCLNGVLLGVPNGVPNFQQLLQDIIEGKDLYTNGEESQGLRHYPRGSTRTWNHLKRGGMSRIALLAV